MKSQRLIFHAGMGKSGSTAIQWWLGNQAAALAALGVESLRWRRHQGAATGWQRVVSGSATSAHAGLEGSSDPFFSLGPFSQSLTALGASTETVVISAESWYSRLYR